MHLLIKWFYGYKNLGDELIIFSLLNRIEWVFAPKKISIECGDEKRLENRILKHKSFLTPWTVNKLEFLPKPNRKEKVKLCLWMKKNLYDYIIFWWWEVVDESRALLYRWWNLYFQYKSDIKRWNVAIVGWLWDNKKFGTKYLQKFLINNANIIILRDKSSFELAKWILIESWQNREDKIQYEGDLTLSLLEEAKEIFEKEKIKSTRNPYFLVNISPLCEKKKSLKAIKKYADSHKNLQPIYLACNKNDDREFFNNVVEILPNCESFDRTQASITDTLKLFYFAKWWIWARLHFLYILKFFEKPFVQLHKSHKIQVNLSDLDQD